MSAKTEESQKRKSRKSRIDYSLLYSPWYTHVCILMILLSCTFDSVNSFFFAFKTSNKVVFVVALYEICIIGSFSIWRHQNISLWIGVVVSPPHTDSYRFLAEFRVYILFFTNIYINKASEFLEECWRGVFCRRISRSTENNNK